MKSFFTGSVHCPGCGAMTSIHVKAEAQSLTAPTDTATLYIPIEEARCQLCNENFPIYFYEDGVELVVEETPLVKGEATTT